MITYRLEVQRVTRDRQARWEPVPGMDSVVGAMGYEALEAERRAIANRIAGARFRMGRANRVTKGARRTLRDLPRTVIAVRIVVTEA